ncbi:MAG TPA: hypothetical protein VEC37_02445 [Bacillota bacterium]|nr:hypothetical protein [Bacillota bacterium]
MINQLESLLVELATDLQKFGKQDTAKFFLTTKENILNTKNITDLKGVLEQLMSSGAITQYADFSFKQEALFNKIYEAAKVYKESL